MEAIESIDELVDAREEALETEMEKGNCHRQEDSPPENEDLEKIPDTDGHQNG